jgi:hypothetical protein
VDAQRAGLDLQRAGDRGLAGPVRPGSGRDGGGGGDVIVDGDIITGDPAAAGTGVKIKTFLCPSTPAAHDAGGGDDILIGGQTSYDTDAASAAGGSIGGLHFVGRYVELQNNGLDGDQSLLDLVGAGNGGDPVARTPNWVSWQLNASGATDELGLTSTQGPTGDGSWPAGDDAAPANNLHQLGLASHTYDSGIF